MLGGVPTETSFLPQDKALEAVDLHRRWSDREYSEKIKEAGDWVTRRRAEIDRLELDEPMLGLPHVKRVLESENARQDPLPVHLQGLPFIPKTRSPRMFKDVSQWLQLPDERLGEDIGEGFPMQDTGPHGNWLTVSQAEALGMDWGAERARREKRAAAGRVTLPIPVLYVRESEVGMYKALKEQVLLDTDRGRYVQMDWADLPEGAEVAKMFPIDQSYMSEDGLWIVKYRTIFDGRGPNKDYEYKEKARILNTLALREIILALVALDPSLQRGQPTSERRAVAWAAMQQELERKEGLPVSKDKVVRHKILHGSLEIDVHDNSIAGLVDAFREVSEALRAHNGKIQAMKLRAPKRPTLALFTRDWSKAY
jgi:hypothetical protein